MPKLRDHVVQKNQTSIEEAALRLFIRQGYFGTSIRDIAAEAGISIGNIYNYYPNKEALYVSLVRRYSARIAKEQLELTPLLGKFDTASLRLLAQKARDIVYSNPDYWRLMYIDVTEFGNRHFAHSFRRLSKTLEKMAGGYRKDGLRSGIDPSLAYGAIYLQFFTYFLVEKLFGGKQHLGQPESVAIEQLIQIFRNGSVAAGPYQADQRQEKSDETDDPMDRTLRTDHGAGAVTDGSDADNWNASRLRQGSERRRNR